MEEPPKVGQVHAAVAAVMTEIGGVAKGRTNQHQGWKFRGVADVYLACQPLLAKHGLHFAPHAVLAEHIYERKTSKGSLMMHVIQRVEFRIYHADGSWFPVVTTGEAMDSGGDKACGKCMSYAAKYALIQAFCLPEEDPEVDTESDSPEAMASEPAQQQRMPPSRTSAPAQSKPAPAAPHPIHAKLVEAGKSGVQINKWLLNTWGNANWRSFTPNMVELTEELMKAWIVGDDEHAKRYEELKDKIKGAWKDWKAGTK